MFRALLERVARGEALTRDEAREAGQLLAAGGEEPLAVAAFLGAMAARGEQAQELAGLAEAFRAVAAPFGGAPGAIDTCGTGGDGSGSFNVSTAAAVVVAALAVPVAKHGNRSLSSRCGSADLLEAAGYPVAEPPAAAAARLTRDGFAFLFAPGYHPAMAHVAPVRRALKVRTVFNLLGPLLNPAGVRRQVVGVFAEGAQDRIAEALLDLGAERALVVCGAGRYDEAVTWGATRVLEVRAGRIERYEVGPSDFGLPEGRPEDLAGGGPDENLARLRSLLAGEASPRLAEIVAANAALALKVAGAEESLPDGAARALEQLRSGAVGAFFRRLLGPCEVACA